MNKMNYQDYTIPTGNECIISSRIEALAQFAKLNLKGRIYFGAIYTDCQTEVLGWVLKFRQTICPLQAFNETENKLGNVIKVLSFSPGTIIFYKQRFYMYVEDPVLQTALREIVIFASEQDLINAYRSRGDEIEIKGLYEMTQIGEYPPAPFLCWMIRSPNQFGSFFLPVFLEDAVTLRKHNIYDFNWTSVAPGYRIRHNGTTYQVYRHDLADGSSELFINRPPHNPYMKLLKT